MTCCYSSSCHRHPMSLPMILLLLLAFLTSYLPIASATDVYATCDGCLCIPDVGEECPNDPLPLEHNPMMIDNMLHLQHENPIALVCENMTNPETCTTDPPLEEGGACVVEIIEPPKPNDNSSSAPPTCPQGYSYRLKTVESRFIAEQNLEVVTHEGGGCGTCSSLQDLAVFIQNPDLSSLGIQCGFRALTNVTDGIECYVEAGFTQPCGMTFLANTFITNRVCGDLCVAHALGNKPNNLEPPTCYLADCIQCDEDNAGPFFMKFASRTRRRSGLLSAIVRNCSSLVKLTHRDPCDINAPPLTLPPTATPTTTEPTSQAAQQQDNNDAINRSSKAAATLCFGHLQWIFHCFYVGGALLATFNF